MLHHRGGGTTLRHRFRASRRGPLPPAEIAELRRAAAAEDTGLVVGEEAEKAAREPA